MNVRFSRRLRATVISMAVLALAALSAASCTTSGRADPAQADATVKVATTIYPVTYLTQRVGGDRVAVSQLVSEGDDAADFQPAPEDVETVRGVSLLLYTDPSLEPWVDGVVTEASGSVTAIPVADLTVDAGAERDVTDIWLNPVQAIIQVEGIFAALSSEDPEGEETYRTNAQEFIAELEDLNEHLAASLEDCPALQDRLDEASNLSQRQLESLAAVQGIAGVDYVSVIKANLDMGARAGWLQLAAS